MDRSILGYHSDQTPDRFACMAYISMLFSLLLQHVPYHIMEQQEATVAVRKEERLSRILQYLEVHFREPLRLAELARQEGLTQA